MLMHSLRMGWVTTALCVHPPSHSRPKEEPFSGTPSMAVQRRKGAASHPTGIWLAGLRQYTSLLLTAHRSKAVTWVQQKDMREGNPTVSPEHLAQSTNSNRIF